MVLAGGRELCTLSGHHDFVNAVALTPNGQRAVSASEDWTLKVRDLASGRELCTLSGHTNYVKAVAVTPCHSSKYRTPVISMSWPGGRSATSHKILAMIVWLRHFLGWVVSAFKSHEDLILRTSLYVSNC